MAKDKAAHPKSVLESRIVYVLATTGPQVLDLAVNDYLKENDDLLVYPQSMFYSADVLDNSSENRRLQARRDSSFQDESGVSD